MLYLLFAALTLDLSLADSPTTAPSFPPTPPLTTVAPTLVPTALPAPTPASTFKGDTYGHLSLNSFAPYPGLAGANVSGYVLLTHMMDTVTIDYNLMGVDSTCTTRDPDVQNSCGMHIHVGFSCESDLKVGIHYWDQGTSEAKNPDPWVMGPSYYQYDPSTMMAKGEASIKYGFGVDASKGHAFVIHDRKGTRISCGVLPATTDKVSLGQFAPYPMYEGPLKSVKGCVNMDFRGVSVEVGYNLTGVDPLCSTPNPDIPNSCGLHIHTGMTCTNASEIAGHYFDVGQHYFPSTPMPASGDPWATASVMYNASSGMAMGTLQVDYGFGFDTSRGRAVVLHDYNGTRIACALLPMYVYRVTAPLPALAPYPGFTGTAITGSVKVDFRGKAVKILYNLQNTEPACASGVPGSAPNSCGIHIHSGFTCAEAGAHYFNPSMFMSDPWAVATYKSQTSESSLIVSYGYSFEQTKGRTVVVHSYNGTRVACANIPATSSFAATVTDFMPLPGATAIAATSTVLFDFLPTSVRMTYNLMGVEAACAMHGGEHNSCGLHIHTGYNCSEPGEHFYNTTTDPWAADYYVATPDGRAMGHIDVEYGYGFEDARGRAVVVHNYAGAPVACSTLPMATMLADHAGISKMVPLPGATVPATGTVSLTVSGLGVKMDYALTEVEPTCSSVGPAPLSCGIHIHKGFSCDEPLTHYYNNVTYPADPWMYAVYTSSGTMAYGSVVVSYGEGWAATEGRVVVVHNYAGEKVSCAIIPQTTDQVTATGFKYLANSTAAPGEVLLDFRASSVLMTYHLMNVDAGCNESAPGVMNSCGLHIHSGMSCADVESVGPHYFDNNTIAIDPWATVVYKSDAQGNAMGKVNVEYGFGYAMTKGRVVVVHDKAGVKVLCALIPMQKSENEEMSVAITNMAKYPEYNGPYAVGVTALSLGFNGIGTKIMYELTGVPCECSQMGTAPNSCGIHIHVGTNCMDPTQIGGHWFNKSMIPDDPWATATYTSSNCAGTCLNPGMGTTASGAVTVDYGYGPGQTLDKVLVVHDYLGNRIGCTPISDSMHPMPRDLDMTGVLSIAALNKYPETTSMYGGNVTGGVQLHFVGPEVSISYRVHGVDPRCVEGGRTAAPNSCGMHIHKGWSCESAVAIGGHYFPENMTHDPWQDSYYMADAQGNATGTMSLVFGHTVDESKGRTFVFHDVTGSPMTCSVLGSTTDRVTLGTIMPTANYSGLAKETAGCIALEFRGTSVQINYNLTKVDPRCIKGPKDNTANSCGIHIHAGTSCDNETAMGAHFYDPSLYALDVEPWKYITYMPNDEGQAMSTMNVEYGYGFDMSQGHAFVLHDYDGYKATCNLIPMSPDRDLTPLPALERYPGYEGPLTVEGFVKLDFRGRGVKITYNLTGTEPTCTTPGPAPNSCGIHIHAGFTCETAGAHYFNNTLYPTDPWSSAAYMVTEMAMPGSLIVSYGFDYEHSKGRTVVVHDYSGNRVACAVIPATTDRAMAANFVKVPPASTAVGGNATLDFRATSVHIAYNFTQVDQRCLQPALGVNNSCGLHIHQGLSCEESLIGGHYYNSEIYKEDPWANITYKAVDGNANGVVNVEFGYGFLQSRGHALVLHDMDGKKMSCAIISTGNALRDTVSVVSFMPLETTALQGKVLVDFQGMGVKLSYNLVGVETNCSTVGPAKLSCGIHIHQGFNCSDPMGHYYNANSYPVDPWMYASYTTLGGVARGSLVVSYGEDYAHSMGRSLVLHNYAGEKVACQTIPQITDNVVVENFKPLPNVPENEKMLMGKVALSFRSTSVRMDIALKGTDVRCVEKNPEKPLSCGIHIHVGTCQQPGGHFYNAALFPVDPWTNVSYVSNAEGVAIGLLNVEFGYGYEMSKGKILILHDQDGLKISCSEIGITPLVYTVNSPAPMKKYPAYNGIYTPSMTAQMKYTNEAVTIMFDLSGVPCECSQIGTAPNSCGLHIHEGTSCNTNSLVGGHWFNNRSADPWAYTPYIARKCSEVCTTDNLGTTASGSLTVNYGEDYATTISRVLVVHDYYGVRIGCSPLAGVPRVDPAGGGPFPLVPVIIGGGGFLLLLALVFLYCRRRKTQRGRVGTLNEKLAPPGGPLPAGQVRNAQNPTRRTLSVNHM